MIGRGIYYEACRNAMEVTNAKAVFMIVIDGELNGKKAHGACLTGQSTLIRRIPEILRKAADEMEMDIQMGTNPKTGG